MKLMSILIISLSLLVSCGEDTTDENLNALKSSIDTTSFIDTTMFIDTIIRLDSFVMYDTIHFLDSSIRIDSITVIDTVKFVEKPSVLHSIRDTLIPYGTSISYNYPDETEPHIDCIIPMTELGNFNVAFNANGERDYRIYNDDPKMSVRYTNNTSDEARKDIAKNVVWNNPNYVFEWIVTDEVGVDQDYRIKQVGDILDTLYFSEDSLFLSTFIDPITSKKYVKSIRRYEDNFYLYEYLTYEIGLGNVLVRQNNYPLLNPLMYKPVSLRISHYYKKHSQQPISGVSKVTLRSQVESGVEVSQMNEFSKTVSNSETKDVSVTAGGSWASASVGYSETVSKSLTRTSTRSQTISEKKTEEYSVEVSAKEGGTTVYTLWQKVEIFEFVDDNGNKWDASDIGFNLKTDGPDGIFGFKYYLPKEVYTAIVTDFYSN